MQLITGLIERHRLPRRVATAIALATALLAAASIMAASVDAAAPSRDPAPTPPEIVDESCGYPIVVTFPVNGQIAMSFVDRNGDPTKLIVAGGLIAVFTNPATGDWIKASISGPTILVLSGGRFVGTGTWALWPDGHLTVLAGQIDGVGLVHGTVIRDICLALPLVP